MNSQTLTIVSNSIVVIIMQFFYIRAFSLRFHDLNKSGWLGLLALLAFIPAIGGLIVLVLTIYLMASAGTIGNNDYGEQPKKGHIIGLIITCISPIGLIAIFIAFAIPAYQEYTLRIYASEGLALASGAQSAVIDYYREHKQYPSSNQQAQLPEARNIQNHTVSAVEVDRNGNIIIQFNEKLKYDTIIMTPYISADSIQWRCNQETLSQRYRPTKCREFDQ
jgi:type IV pilus assembly protein PilA